MYGGQLKKRQSRGATGADHQMEGYTFHKFNIAPQNSLLQNNPAESFCRIPNCTGFFCSNLEPTKHVEEETIQGK